MTGTRRRALTVSVAALLAGGLAACAGPVPKSLETEATTPVITAVQLSGSREPVQQVILSEARQFVYRARNVNCDAVGTAFSLDGRRVVTNRHVAAGTTSLELSTWSGTDFVASVDGHSRQTDLARLSAPVPKVATQPTIAPAAPPWDEELYVAGYPEGNQLTVSAGNMLDEIDGSPFGLHGQVMEITNKIEPGNSGSPVLNAKGQIVGVVFATEVESGNGLAIPPTELSQFLAGQISTTAMRCANGFAAPQASPPAPVTSPPASVTSPPSVSAAAPPTTATAPTDTTLPCTAPVNPPGENTSSYKPPAIQPPPPGSPPPPVPNKRVSTPTLQVVPGGNAGFSDTGSIVALGGIGPQVVSVNLPKGAVEGGAYNADTLYVFVAPPGARPCTREFLSYYQNSSGGDGGAVAVLPYTGAYDVHIYTVRGDRWSVEFALH